VDDHIYVSHSPTGANGRMMTVISGTQILTTTLPEHWGAGFQGMAADKHTGEMYMFEGSILVYWNGKDIVKRPRGMANVAIR
jgi:hypothetical protein